MGYRPELATTNARIEEVRQRISERKLVPVQEALTNDLVKSHPIPKSGQQGLRLNRKQRRLARRKRKQAEQAAIERMRYAMHAQEARANYDAVRDEVKYWSERALDAESRI